MADQPKYTRNAAQGGPPARILFIGINGAFSIPPLEALIQNDIAPQAVITTPPPGVGIAFRRVEIPASPPGHGETLFSLCSRHEIPVYEVGHLRNRTAVRMLNDVDYAVAACFPRLLPPAWLNAPRQGCINLHPSLLPAYRGPHPVEDQLAAGEEETGVTLHLMDETADTGDILAQQVFPVPAGATVDSLTRLAAGYAAELLVQFLAAPENYPPRRQSGTKPRPTG